MLIFALTIVAAGQSFTCTPTRVADGDGPIWCAEGPTVRLGGIDTRSMDGSCASGEPCRVSAAEARDHLVGLIGRAEGESSGGHVRVEGAPLRCVSAGTSGLGRTNAWCVNASGQDLSCTMLRDGMANRWNRSWRGHRC